jgi:hypothetical protein
LASGHIGLNFGRKVCIKDNSLAVISIWIVLRTMKLADKRKGRTKKDKRRNERRDANMRQYEI